MPITRKIVRIGGGRYVAVPPNWLEYWEKKYGRPIEELLMEINNQITLTIERPDENEESRRVATESSR